MRKRRRLVGAAAGSPVGDACAERVAISIRGRRGRRGRRRDQPARRAQHASAVARATAGRWTAAWAGTRLRPRGRRQRGRRPRRGPYGRSRASGDGPRAAAACRCATQRSARWRSPGRALQLPGGAAAQSPGTSATTRAHAPLARSSRSAARGPGIRYEPGRAARLSSFSICRYSWSAPYLCGLPDLRVVALQRVLPDQRERAGRCPTRRSRSSGRRAPRGRPWRRGAGPGGAGRSPARRSASDVSVRTSTMSSCLMRVADAVELGPDVRLGIPSRRRMPHVEQDAVTHHPPERDLVDRPRGPPPEVGW